MWHLTFESAFIGVAIDVGGDDDDADDVANAINQVQNRKSVKLLFYQLLNSARLPLQKR